MSTETQSAPAGRRERVLGMTAQTAGVVGIIVCFALIAGVVLGRGWAVGRVDELAGKVDDGLAKGVPLLETASTKVAGVSARVGLVVDAAEARAADPGPAPALVETLQLAMGGITERYLELRTAYADAHEAAVSVMDRLNTIEGLVPAISIPQGPREKLAEVDAKAREIDAAVMQVIDARPGVGSGQVASVVADKAGQVESKLDELSAGLDAAKVRLLEIRQEVANTADSTNQLITIAALVLILGLLYLVLLHWVLYRSGSSLRQDPDAKEPPASGT